MSRRDLVDVLEYAIEEVINVSRRDIVVGNNDRADRDSRNIVVSSVDALFDYVLAVVGGLGDERENVFIVKADEINFLRGRE